VRVSASSGVRLVAPEVDQRSLRFGSLWKGDHSSGQDRLRRLKEEV